MLQPLPPGFANAKDRTMHGFRINTEDDLRAGIAELVRLDARLAAIHALSGDPPLRRSPPGFDGIVSIIIAQQVSVASARAIETRVRSVFDPLTPEVVADAHDAMFRDAGLSTPKIRTLRALAGAVLAGDLVLDALASLTADEAAARLCSVHGVGPWTADIYLLFCLGHPDAFPAGDLAVQEAARVAFDLTARPSARALSDMASGWRPWRGVAARLLFAYYAAIKQGRVARARVEERR